MVSNNCGVDDFGLGLLLKDRQIRKMIASYVGENAEFERQLLSGELEVELTPQGTLAEKIQAGGAGIPAFYSGHRLRHAPSAKARKRASSSGRKYILEQAIVADFALVKGWKADWYGNVVYRYPAQNFNLRPATAGRITVVEVEENRRAGRARAVRQIHTPGIYVDRLIQERFEKRIEKLTVRAQPEEQPMALTREQMAQRVARELQDGYYVNLGIGIPTLVANYIPANVEVMLNRRTACSAWSPLPHARRSRRRHDQRRETNRHGARRGLDLLVRRFVRDDSRRSHRPDRARRLRSGRRGEHRFVDGARQAREGHGWRDGSGSRRRTTSSSP